MLSDNRDELLRRFMQRTEAAAEPAHVDAGWLVTQAGGRDAFMAMYDRLLLIVAARPGAQVVNCPEGAEEQAYEELRRRMGTLQP